jgi:hypothetical protein
VAEVALGVVAAVAAALVLAAVVAAELVVGSAAAVAGVVLAPEPVTATPVAGRLGVVEPGGVA